MLEDALLVLIKIRFKFCFSLEKLKRCLEIINKMEFFTFFYSGLVLLLFPINPCLFFCKHILTVVCFCGSHPTVEVIFDS